ncbi:MAG: PD40 domain-containing protein, partial [Actinobacteria bacterium]|nr:PD40 domain-containing protein [Actinomycetota bacterium]
MTELIPRRVLFGNPERTSPRISPDGTMLAWIAPHNGVLNVWTAPAGAGGVDWDAARMVTDDTDRGIRMFGWAHDGRHLLYLQDTGGDENWRLYDVDLPTMTRRDLTPFEGVRAEIIAGDPKHPTEVLVGLNRDNPQLHDVYRLDLLTGELIKEVTNPGFAGWVADADLVVRAGLAPQPDGGLVIMARNGADGGWRPLLAFAAEDALTSEPLAVSADGRSLLAISSVGADTGRLVRVDLASGETTVLAADPDA